MPDPLHHFDREVRKEGFAHLCGVDEVGRGPLAGPVVAAAVILDPSRPVHGLADSKALTPKRRSELEDQLRGMAVAIGVGCAEPSEIDSLNILKATFLAMERALENLGASFDLLLIDGNQRLPGFCFPQKTVVKGDARSASIAAASIIAKEHRDRLMLGYGTSLPGYFLEANMGYGTAEHLAAIKKLGPSPIHRKTFRGVREHLPGTLKNGLLFEF